MVNARNVQDPVELFGLHISHIGINAATDEEVEEIVGLFSSLMGLRREVSAPISVFAGTLVEVMRPGASRGEKGHIGFYVNDIPAALRWFGERGFEADPTLRVLNPDGSIRLVYFKRQIAGFAIHLMSDR